MVQNQLFAACVGPAVSISITTVEIYFNQISDNQIKFQNSVNYNLDSRESMSYVYMWPTEIGIVRELELVSHGDSRYAPFLITSRGSKEDWHNHGNTKRRM